MYHNMFRMAAIEDLTWRNADGQQHAKTQNGTFFCNVAYASAQEVASMAESVVICWGFVPSNCPKVTISWAIVHTLVANAVKKLQKILQHQSHKTYTENPAESEKLQG